jgi:hyperosmotically inducible periplasmic protein
MKHWLTALALLAAIGCKTNSDAETRPSNTADAPADNTGKNERDRGSAAVTPGDQSETETDRKITQQIRQGVVGSDELSVSGKNVKIVTADGIVTLRGPVTTEKEKADIARIVKGVDGVKRVENQLEIAAK